MTESDVVARAARALREAYTGEREGSGFTRARIMNTVHRERRRRTLRWAVFSPLASLLLLSSAWAQSSGKWPVIWKAVTSVFVAAPEPPPAAPSPGSARREAAPRGAGARSFEGDAGRGSAQAAPGDTLEPAAAEPVVVETPAVEPPAAQLPRPLERVRRRPPARPRAAAEPSAPDPRPAEPAERAPSELAPAAPQRDPEIERFRAAHDLHFKGQARAAVAAYRRYLRDFPNGRFVPEARYAMALDQLELGDEAAAREALAPFAEGRYGDYRRREARELLDALDRKKAGGR